MESVCTNLRPKDSTYGQGVYNLGTEQLSNGKAKSIMKWYVSEGDYNPKDENLPGWTFA